MDYWISLLLRGGVLLSALLIVIGMAMVFVHHPSYATSGAVLAGIKNPAQGSVPHRVSDVWELIRNGRGRGVVALGLLVLIVTPIMRVAFSVVTFWIEKDRIFVLITSAVLALLILSLMLGKVG